MFLNCILNMGEKKDFHLIGASMPNEIKYFKKIAQTTCSLMFLNCILNKGEKKDFHLIVIIVVRR